MRVGLFSQDKRTQSQAVPGEVQVDHQEEFLHRKDDQMLEWTSQRGSEVSNPGDI